MSDVFRATFERLRRNVLARPPRVFAEARTRQPELAPHADVASALLALADEREATYPARDALSRALLFEHRRGMEPLWASMLTVAFYPMLSRLRHRLISDTVPKDELDQVVIAAFLGTLNELPLREDTDRLPMRLRQRTQRTVFSFLRKELEQRQPPEALELLMTLEAENAALSPRPSSDEKLYDLALLLERATAQGIPASSIEVMAATVQNREQLRTYVDRIGPADRAERERLYQRLKRQRSRVLRRLRNLQAAVSPPRSAAGF